MTENRSCPAITRSGNRCKGIAIDRSGYCYAHDPARADERKRNATRAGRIGGKGRARPGEVEDVRRLLRGLINSVLRGDTDPKSAAVAGQLLNTLLRAITVEMQLREQLELVERLEALEDGKVYDGRGRFGA